MRYIHFDSVGGASGDMLLGALVSLGADQQALAARLAALVPEPLRLLTAQASDRGLHGLRLTVATAEPADAAVWTDAATTPAATPHGHEHGHGHGHGHAHAVPAPATHAHPRAHAPHRTLGDILAILGLAQLPPAVERTAAAVFRRLAAAEAQIHGKTAETIHFHEVGAADSIADVVGCCLALDMLGVAGVSVGPLPCGTGTLRCAHGVMPNPAPATMLLLQGLQVVRTDEPSELVTPTGAALLATWCEMLSSPPPRLRVLRTGMGFGQRTLRDRPNVLRATLLESDEGSSPASAADDLLVLETNLDDCNPQWIGDLIGRLLEHGALDAWATPTLMKKGRPALILGVLCAPDAAEVLRGDIFAATTTFGIRAYAVTRATLARRIASVDTPYGPVRVKIGSLDGREVVRTPEFEDCAARAREHGVAPRQVSEAARAAHPPASADAAPPALQAPHAHHRV